MIQFVRILIIVSLQVLHVDSLKSAIVKLVSTQNLSFKLIESREFIDLLKLCNPAIEKFLVFWESKWNLVDMFRPTWSHPTRQMVLSNPMFVADKRSHRCTNTFFSFFRNLRRTAGNRFLQLKFYDWPHLEQFQSSRTKFEIGLPP